MTWIHKLWPKKVLTRRLVFLFLVILLALVVPLLLRSQPVPAAPEAPALLSFQVPDDLPRYNWRVCEDLGVGPVPGVPDARQRFRLCHNQGWQLLAYCLQPTRPAPVVGATCSRTNDDTYWCGDGIQNLREYAVLQTPAPTPTPSPTSTPTATPSPTPTSTGTLAPPPRRPSVTPRLPSAPGIPRAAQPGGIGVVLAKERLVKGDLVPNATRTPFLPLSITPTPSQPLHPTPDEPAEGSPASSEPTLNFYGIDLNDHSQRVRIQIFPPNKKVNGGKPIVISFIPGNKCNFGDGRACVSAYLSESLSEVDFLTVHSGVGGEGQAFRHAVEGTGENQAAYTLKQALANLRHLAGAEVIITQGGQAHTGFTLAVAARVPGRALKAYFKSPIQTALEAAAEQDPALAPFLSATQPQLVFETCGWMMPGEQWAPGVTGASASVYLGIIQKAP